MYLRRIILIFSVSVIAFALSLYFQTGQKMKKTSWNQYQHVKVEKGQDHRLTNLNQYISPYQLEELIQKRILVNRLLREKTRVMEIDGGNGIAIMELKKKFPEVEFYIINRKKSYGIYRKENIGGAALEAKIISAKELEDLELPYLIFRDLDNGAPIPYKDNKFDIIYSYNFLPLIKYKFEFISETLRVLKNGGYSVHLGSLDIQFYHSGLRIDQREAIHQLRKLGFDIHQSETFLIFKKTINHTTLPLRPHFPIPSRHEVHDLKNVEMGYHLPE